MKHGSFFNGIGGFQYAAECVGFENVFSCEIDTYCNTVTKHHYPYCIQHGDITKESFKQYNGQIDIITGGFPCQDASVANWKGQKGISGSRTGLVYHQLRAIKEIKPKYGVFENVSNLLQINGGRDFIEILKEISAMGYNAEWRVIYANEQGAPHKRSRVYMVIYPDSIRLSPDKTFLPYVPKKIKPFHWEFAGKIVQIIRGGTWDNQPPVLLLDDGVSKKLVGRRLKAMGNAIVPQIAMDVFKSIQEYELNYY